MNNSPMWLQENFSMTVTVKRISNHYEVSPQKVRNVIKKLGFKENKTDTKYLYVFSSNSHKDKLNKIHEELTK
jgi:DNA-binding Lrp family transcriptional regulator